MIFAAEWLDRLAWTAGPGLLLVLLALWMCRWTALPATAKVWICRLAWLRLAVGPFLTGYVFYANSTIAGPEGEAVGGALPIAWLWTFLFVVYGVGVAFESAGLFRSALTARAWLREARPLPVGVDLSRLARQMGLARAPRVAVLDRLREPCVSGVTRPRLYVPQGFDPAEDRLAAAHELAHLRHGDLYWTLLATLAQALFWFLPGLTALCRETALWQEARADAAARRALGASASEMARRVLAAASARPAYGLSFGAVETERRIRAILEPRSSSTLLLAGLAIVAVAAVPIRIEQASARRSDLGPSRTPVLAAPVSPIRVAEKLGG